MTEKEAIEQIESLIDDFNIGNDFDLRVNATDVKALQTVLQLLEQKDKRIDDLEKALLWCIDMEKKYDWGDSSDE